MVTARYFTLLLNLLFAHAWGTFSATQAAERPEVFIYYANETAPDAAETENYATFVNWLQTSHSEKARAVATGLTQDRLLFPQAVDTEVAAMEAHAREGQAQVLSLIFTNRLVREGRCLACDSRQERKFRSIPITPLASDHVIVASNPLSQNAMLWQALVTAAEIFPPRQHAFVLLTKSHGGAELALTVKLARRAEEVTREQVLQHLERGTSDIPPASIGTSKHEYLELLRRAGEELEMTFPLVFMESCQGTFTQSQAQAVPPNVAALFASGDRYLQYRTLDYPELLRQADDSGSLSGALGDFLAPRYLSITRPNAGWTTWLRWIWFLPLVGWIIWFLWQRRPRAPIPTAAEGEGN